MTHYLRFPDKSTGMAALDAAVCFNSGGPACVNTGAVTNPLELD
jgi:hypothetical protein